MIEYWLEVGAGFYDAGLFDGKTLYQVFDGKPELHRTKEDAQHSAAMHFRSLMWKVSKTKRRLIQSIPVQWEAYVSNDAMVPVFVITEVKHDG